MGNLLDCAVYSDELPYTGNMSPEEGKVGSEQVRVDLDDCVEDDSIPELVMTPMQLSAIQMMRDAEVSERETAYFAEVPLDVIASPIDVIESLEARAVKVDLSNNPADDDNKINSQYMSDPNREFGTTNEFGPVQTGISDQHVPLCESPVWQWQRDFYIEHHIKCWNGTNGWNVPDFVTSNCFIADKYARFIVDFIRDLLRAGRFDSSEPLYVVELGSGSGKLGYHIAHRLLELSEFLPPSCENLRFPVCVVLTDVSQTLVAQWKQHPPLLELLQRGVLDVSVLDAECDTSFPNQMNLEYSNTIVYSPTVNPVLSIANYLFDSLTQDLFQVVEGKLHRGLCSISEVPQEESQGQQQRQNGVNKLRFTWSTEDIGVPVVGNNSCRIGGEDFSTVAYERGQAQIDYKLAQAVHSQKEYGQSKWYNSTTDYGTVLSTTDPSVLNDIPTDSSILNDVTKSVSTPDDARIGSTTLNVGQYDFHDNRTSLMNEEIGKRVLVLLLDLLREYPELQEQSSILIPVGALRVLENLRTFSGGHMVLLTGDKGYTHPGEFSGIRNPHIASHGSISFMVNYHLIQRYCQVMHGSKVVRTQFREGFKCLAVLCVPQDNFNQHQFLSAEERLHLTAYMEATFARTLASFEQLARSFGPEQFSVLQRCVKDECPNPSLKQILNLCRLSRADQDVLFKFRSQLMDRIGFPFCAESVQQDARYDLEKVSNRYYPLHRKKDVRFEIGRLHMALEEYQLAVCYFEQSKEECGQHYITDHNIGICMFYLGEYRQAAESFRRSLLQRDDYEEAKIWLAKVHYIQDQS